MWLLFGICIMIVTTECADTNGFKNGEHFATNWGASKPPDIFKLPREILLFSTPYNSSMPYDSQQWNEILPMGSNQSGRETATTNKIIGNTESEYQMVQHRSSRPPLPTWLFARNIDNEKERRNPSFSAWGGKRSSSPYKADPRIRRPSRVPFNSWGGKRNHVSFNRDSKYDANTKQLAIDNLPGNKRPFNSWGGKRTPILIEYLVSLSSKDVLKNILQSTHAPLTLTSINRHMKQDSVKADDENSGVEDNNVRIMFEPWNGEKIHINSNENDIIVPSATSLQYTQ